MENTWLSNLNVDEPLGDEPRDCFCTHCKSQGYYPANENCLHYVKPEPEPLPEINYARRHTLKTRTHRY